MRIITDVSEYVLIGVGSLVSLSNIETILGIIILIVQASWLGVKLGVKIYQYIKRGKELSDLDPDVDTFIDFIEDGKLDERQSNFKK